MASRRGRAPQPGDPTESPPDALAPAVRDEVREKVAPEVRAGVAPEVRARIDALPEEPGVYLFKDRRGRIFYVGKAADLRARVRSYFGRGGDTRPFVATLDRRLADVETVVTRSAKEALLLENNLIKLHRPRFNVLLRDDKNFLVLRLDDRVPWPRADLVRKIGDDGARYFGPYHSATAARATLRAVNRHFALRTCSDRVFAQRKRPCLQFFIKRCPAPCVLDVPRDAYLEQVHQAALFLAGRREELTGRLRANMAAASADLAYERAAELRDRIAALEVSLETQRVVLPERRDLDVVGFHRDGATVDLAVLHVRQGKLLGRRTWALARQEVEDADVIAGFVGSYYDAGEPIPDAVLLPCDIDDRAAKTDWLTEKRGRRVEIVAPRRGARRELLDIAMRNAEAAWRQRTTRAAEVTDALEKLQARLSLAKLPRRIECVDVSHLGGTATVASIVSFLDGEPEKSRYKRMKLKQAERNDDFAAMYEALSRRFRRAKAGDDGWELPDLLVIDGGKGQLGSARAALRDAGLDGALDLCALAKERKGEDKPDRVFLPGAKDALRLRPNSAALYVLAHVRDEAHRFAVAYHRKLRRIRALRSALDDVDGVGRERRRALLLAFGSLRALRDAEVGAIARVPGMTHAAAEAVAKFLAGLPGPDRTA